jgi:hypothetical protein
MTCNAAIEPQAAAIRFGQRAGSTLAFATTCKLLWAEI